MHAYCQRVPCGVLCCSLLQAGADPRLKAADGMTPVHAAAQMGRTDCLAFLVSSTTLACLSPYSPAFLEPS